MPITPLLLFTSLLTDKTAALPGRQQVLTVMVPVLRQRLTLVEKLYPLPGLQAFGRRVVNVVVLVLIWPKWPFNPPIVWFILPRLVLARRTVLVNLALVVPQLDRILPSRPMPIVLALLPLLVIPLTVPLPVPTFPLLIHAPLLIPSELFASVDPLLIPILPPLMIALFVAKELVATDRVETELVPFPTAIRLRPTRLPPSLSPQLALFEVPPSLSSARPVLVAEIAERRLVAAQTLSTWPPSPLTVAAVSLLLVTLPFPIWSHAPLLIPALM